MDVFAKYLGQKARSSGAAAKLAAQAAAAQQVAARRLERRSADGSPMPPPASARAYERAAAPSRLNQVGAVPLAGGGSPVPVFGSPTDPIQGPPAPRNWIPPLGFPPTGLDRVGYHDAQMNPTWIGLFPKTRWPEVVVPDIAMPMPTQRNPIFFEDGSVGFEEPSVPRPPIVPQEVAPKSLRGLDGAPVEFLNFLYALFARDK